MLSREALREQAKRLPSVMVPSETLLELLDAAEGSPAKQKAPRAPRAPRQANDDDEKCARWLYDEILKTAPRFKEPNFTTWAKEVRLMRERDGRAHKEICELFRWAHSIRFWRGNILSPTKLREHWDRLTIQRDTAAELKAPAAVAWWTSEAAKLAKANEVGVGRARAGESTASWEARIREAIDNGGKPPAPPAHVRPVSQPISVPQPPARAGKPEGLVLKDLVRQGPPPARAA